MNDLDADRIHVQAPSDIIFLCGGQRSDISEAVPLSLRDAFLKIVNNPATYKRDVIQAEDISATTTFFDTYENILDLETDLAQIVELIILFCESEGSLAELGAFSMISEIASRLFVIVRERHWKDLSFVRLGPLRRLEKRYGRDSIFVIGDAQVGIRGDSVANVDKEALKSLLNLPLSLRLERRREPTTFDSQSSGHVIKLIVGLIQEYGALTALEIREALSILKVEKIDKEIDRYLLCAREVGWLTQVSKGTSDYFVARTNMNLAATLHRKSSADPMNAPRRRLLIREYWAENESLRYSAINETTIGA